MTRTIGKKPSESECLDSANDSGVRRADVSRQLRRRLCQSLKPICVDVNYNLPQSWRLFAPGSRHPAKSRQCEQNESNDRVADFGGNPLAQQHCAEDDE